MKYIKLAKKLLEIEWLKFSTNSLVRLIVVVYILMSTFIILMGKSLFKNVGPQFPSTDVFYEFPTVWDYQGYVGNWTVSMLLGFLVIYMITNEVTYKTMRQNIINGLTRFEYLLGKLSVIVVLSFFATVLYWISSFIYGMTHTPGFDWELAFDNNWAGFRFMLMSLGYLIMAALIAFVVRRGTLALMIYFVYILIAEFLLRMLQFYYIRNRAILFWPENSIEDLMPLPLLKMGDFWLEKQWGFSVMLTYTEAVIMSLIYTSLFLYFIWINFRKRDI